MNATNRVMNRVVLFIAGVILLSASVSFLAVGLLAAGNPPAWAERGLSTASDTWAAASGWMIEVAGVGAVSVLLLIASAVVLVLAILLLVFVFTRGRGRATSVLDIDAEGGRTVVDRTVADAVLTDALSRRPDVVSARTGAYRVRKTFAIELAVTVQPGASLATVVAAAEAAVGDWDELIGTRVPIMLHLSDRRWRDALQRRSRVT